MFRRVFFVCLALVMAGCGGGGGSASPGLQAQFECADVYNSRASLCEPIKAGWLIGNAHALDINAGAVSRGQPINVQQIIDNPSPVSFDGWVRAEFDAGCNGAPTWEIMPLQRITIAAGEQVDVSVGGFCGDMPLGARTLTGTAYAPDGVTVIDSVTVQFFLVE